jgi:cytochrome c peroxidase
MTTSPTIKLAAASAAIFVWVCAFAPSSGSQAQEPEGNYGVGIPEVFLPKYLAFRDAQLASAAPDVMRIRLGYVKGLSTSFVNMVGEASVDLESGAFNISLSGLTPLQLYTVWLIDRPETELVPPLPDTVVGLVSFLATLPTALLNGLIPISLPPGFTIDRVVVTPGLLSGGEPLGAGSVNVFQKIFHRRLSLVNDSTGQILFEETDLPPARFDLVPDLATETDFALFRPVAGPRLLHAASLGVATLAPRLERVTSRQAGGSVKLDKLISKGARLFFEETFNGNGRTCGTCHPASNNFTIDAPFIATRPANDPLFVAEFNPALAQLERPALMRSFGLILENLDGLSDPTTKFVMRGVPHTLGLQVSLERDTTQVPTPAEMTGWSGDGAPNTGSLRDFAIGAVTQHFTRRLQRVVGTDFKLPKENQLDAMEAFQLSLGRNRDTDLSRITFKPTTINLNAGRNLFVNGGGNPNFGGTCNFCHTNAGALSASLQNQNRNFNTNVEDRPHPARTEVQNFPKDGGFGLNNNGDGTFGNRAFNTASVVEAADTAPFFHNNVEGTLEDAVRFYTGPEFNNPRAPSARFSFTNGQINRIAAFLRGLNTIQNIEMARLELAEILANNGNPRAEQDRRLQTAFDETQDAIDVLSAANLYPDAQNHLIAARNLISQAQVTEPPSQRRPLIQQAITKLDAANSAVATISAF